MTQPETIQMTSHFDDDDEDPIGGGEDAEAEEADEVLHVRGGSAPSDDTTSPTFRTAQSSTGVDPEAVGRELGVLKANEHVDWGDG